MEHELAAYLAEFESEVDRDELGALPRGGLGLEPRVSPVTFAPGAASLLPSLSRLSQAMPPLYLHRAVAVATGLVAEGVLPETLPRGSTPFFTPPPTPPVPPATPEAWTTQMWGLKGQVDGLEAVASVLRNRGTRKSARAANPDAHIQNNYSWYEHRIPSSGLCDPADLSWLDIWFRAKGLLLTAATPPLRGTAGSAIRLWAVSVGRLVSLLVESTNIRSDFFAPPFSIRQAVATMRNTASAPSPAEPMPGLSSTAQGNGGYYPSSPRADTAASWEAMNYAPRPSGGYEELFTGGAEVRLRPRVVWTCLDAPHCKFSGIDVNTTGVMLATWATILDQAFTGWGMTGRTSWDFQVRHRDNVHLARARVDVGAFVENVLNLARVMSDARLSFGQVLMRSTNFYVNAYLDYAGRKGVIASDIVNNARGAWAGIRGAADANLNTAVATTTAAIVAVATAINAAAGAIIGVVLGLLSALTAAEGAAVGTGPTVPLPFYMRVYGGSCADTAWLPPPAAPPPTLPGPGRETTEPDVSDEDPPAPPAKGGALAIGAIGLGLWLLAGKR